ncbi:hypothetical protein KC334_g16386 [Hortaea werneckii]|nr:hypothetical protein KC334_g16386 [Hortaea werneckii]
MRRVKGYLSMRESIVVTQVTLIPTVYVSSATVSLADVNIGQHTCSAQEEEVLLAYDQGYRWQRCPGCGTSTEHITGCNHMTCTFCDEQYCRICGEAHRDDPPGHGRHWNYPNPCPRYNYPVPRNPDDGDPNWPNHGHRFLALDLAGLMFRRQDIEYDDAQSRQVATEYPNSRFSRDQSLDMFQPLDEQDTPYRACARRVANIHHLYRGGHLARRMRSIYYIEHYQPHAYQVNDEMLPLLAALRHVTSYRHNLAVDFENGRAFPMEEAHVIHRILFTHQVHMLRRKFRRFARYTNDIDTGHCYDYLPNQMRPTLSGTENLAIGIFATN